MIRFVSEKVLIVIALVFIIQHVVYSQGITLATQAQYKHFMQTTTYVVRYDDPFSDFSEAIEQSMKRNWKLTEWKMISENEFEQRRQDMNASFLFLSEIMAQGRKDLVFNILNVVLGAKTSDLNKMPDIGSVPLSYVSDEEDYDDEEYISRLDVIMRFIQYYIEMNIRQPGSDIKAIVKENSTQIRNKEIWLLKDDLAEEVNSESKISDIYAGKVRIVSQQEIDQAISVKKKDVLILHKVAPGPQQKTGTCLKFILSVEDGAPFYYNMTDISTKKPALFLPEDFKKL
jgi:hypothetical protein